LIGDNVVVTWEFTADRKTLWFNVYRSATNNLSDAEPITVDFIPAHFRGTKLYHLEDPSPVKTEANYYWIEQVFGGRESTMHGPTEPVMVGATAPNRALYLPIIKNK